MKFTRTLISVAAVLALAYEQAQAAIGPIGELHIVNAVVAPDGEPDVSMLLVDAKLISGQVLSAQR